MFEPGFRQGFVGFQGCRFLVLEGCLGHHIGQLVDCRSRRLQS